MDLSSRRFRTLLTVFSIAFPLLFIATFTYQNAEFRLFEGFSRGTGQNVTTELWCEKGTDTTKAMEGRSRNATTLAVGDQNVTAQSIGEEKQDIGVGPKHHSADTKYDSSSLPTRVVNEDKLFDGLLASTFEEGSCVSRYQSSLYRKASPHKPSSYLKSKLRDYEHLHRTCKFYYKIMKNDTKSSKSDAAAATNCKYLIWTAVGGLGNRMISLASAFLYAILTHRVLLVKFETDMNGLFCEPFPDSSWLLPKDFPHWEDHKHMEKEFSFRVLDLQHTNDEHYNFFHCVHTQQLLQKIPVLILQSNQYFVPSLFLIPSFEQHLIKMFPVKDTIFHHIGQYLFHPSNEAWQFITRFYQAHLANVNEKIGLQIRVFDTRSRSHQVVFNKILSCSFEHKLLPVLTSPLKNQNHTSKAVFIASLYSEYSEKLRTMYMANTSERKEVIGVYQASHEEYQNSNDNKHNMKAWTEIYLLSLSDELITSSFSTFGYVAHSLGGLKPWILKWSYGDEVTNPPCEGAMSMEPCFHYPPKRDCRNNSVSKVSSFFHYTRNCEDFSNGVKLVNVNDKLAR